MNARVARGLLGIIGLAGLSFVLTRVVLAQQSDFSEITSRTEQTSAGTETAMILNPGKGVQRISWAVFYRGEIIGGGNGSRDKPQRLEPMTLVYNTNSRFATKRCPLGGFLVNGVTMCSRVDASYDHYSDLYFGFRGERIPSNRWVPTFNATTQAGAQAKGGTSYALVLWVMFENPDLPKVSVDPLLKYRPYADYLKP